MQQNSPIFAMDAIHNLNFLVDTGSQISIIRKDCIPYGVIETPEERRKEFVGITGAAVRFKTMVDLELKLVDHANKMESINGTFYVNELSNTPNILGIDILQKARMIIDVKGGAWSFGDDSCIKRQASKNLKNRQDFKSWKITFFRQHKSRTTSKRARNVKKNQQP